MGVLGQGIRSQESRYFVYPQPSQKPICINDESKMVKLQKISLSKIKEYLEIQVCEKHEQQIGKPGCALNKGQQM